MFILLNIVIALKQVLFKKKSNEIPAVEDYLNGLNLTGTIVTWDALNTQTKNVEAVRKAHGDYTVPVKANQGTLY